MFIGIGQAFHAPACYALIAMYFSDSRRASANGVYCAGNYLGAAISSLCLASAGVLGECMIPHSDTLLTVLAWMLAVPPYRSAYSAFLGSWCAWAASNVATASPRRAESPSARLVLTADPTRARGTFGSFRVATDGFHLGCLWSAHGRSALLHG